MNASTNSAKVYRDAAAYLFRRNPKVWWGCCDAINKVTTGDPCIRSAQEAVFAAYFKPENTNYVYWGGQWSDDSRERHACRILALCFMAAMVEAGDA